MQQTSELSVDEDWENTAIKVFSLRHLLLAAVQ